MSVNIDKNVQSIINPVIDNKCKLSAWILVQDTHKEKAWIGSHVKGRSNIININLLMKGDK